MTKLNPAPLANPLSSRHSLPWLLMLFVGSGCAALIYEVVWLQLLQLVIGSSGISLGVLLSMFMGGMCLGSLLLPRLISPDHHPLKVYAFLELGIGIFGIAILFGLPLLADMYVGFTGHGVWARTFVAAVCLLPPTVLMGATLPAVARWVKSTLEGVSWMGLFYAGNIGGAVLGCLLAVVLLLVIRVAPVPWVAIAFGRFSSDYFVPEPNIVQEKDVPLDDAEDSYCIYIGEGINVSVAVTKSSFGHLYFHGAGKVQASTSPKDMRLQRMFGHLSVLARESPDDVKDVLVVACGAGVTAGSFVPYPNIERITICDIEPLVPKVVTPIFGEANYHIVDNIDKENPRELDGKEVRVVYDDGRHYIRTLPKEAKFDVITSDPIDPWVKGCATLNTVEYYEMCKEHLNPGGVMSLWIPLYQSNDETIKSVISTFFQVFPNGILFSNDLSGKGFDAVLLGHVEPISIDLDKLQEKLNNPNYARVKESLIDVGFGMDREEITWRPNMFRDEAISLLATYAGRAVDMDGWMENAQINTDRNLRLQYLAGMSVNSSMATELLSGILKYYKFPEDVFSGSSQRIREMKLALQTANRKNVVNQIGIP